MPLFLIPLPKTENESTVMPWQSMGGKAFDPDDLESMTFLQNLYSEAQPFIQPPKRSILKFVLGLFGIPYLIEDPSVTGFRERWGHPFEDVVADATANPDDFMIRQFDPKIIEVSEHLGGIEGFPWFPLDTLYDYEGPDGEALTNEATEQDDEAEDAYFSFSSSQEVPPDKMERIAVVFGKAADNYRPEGDEEPDEAGVTALRAAAEWLRFWADRDHSCEAQRFLQAGQGWIRIQV